MAPPKRQQVKDRRQRTRQKQVGNGEEGDSKELDAQLAAAGLYAKEISGDGNCLFRSLSDQYYGNPDEYERVRAEVVAYLRLHVDEFSIFVDEDWNEYVERMARDGTYGDNLEIVAFAQGNGVDVKIYQPHIVFDIAAGGSASQQLHIAYV